MKRRSFLHRSVSATATLAGSAGFLPRMATALSEQPERRHCIVLWMGGAPSQIDTFDMKPNHANGGEFSEIATCVPGIRFSEHLPRLATQADKLAIVRSLHSKEGDHERATHLVKTGFPPEGAIARPQVCASLAHELCEKQDTLPPLVRISGNQFSIGKPIGPAYLGPRFLPLNVGVAAAVGANGATINEGPFTSLTVDSLSRPDVISEGRESRRGKLWATLESGFLARHDAASVHSHQAIYNSAKTLMTSREASAFDLSTESETIRRRYGVGSFGQGCLLARRLVESGVSFVEVVLDRAHLGGATWDSHSDNFRAVASLSAELDAGWSTLLEELDERGLLDSTTVIWMGEFGRTPKINSSSGRDHFPTAFSAVLSGGRTKTGQVYGRTSDDGTSIEDRPVSVPEFLATVCQATGVHPRTMIENEAGRPIPIVDASAIGDLVA